MEISQQQLNEWRELMRRVCLGTLEVQQSLAAHNREKVNLILEHLGGEAARAVASLDQSGAQALSYPGFMLSDCSHDTLANRQYLSALRNAMHAAQVVDLERSEDEMPAADLVQLLVANVTRKIFGPPVDVDSLFSEEQS